MLAFVIFLVCVVYTPTVSACTFQKSNYTRPLNFTSLSGKWYEIGRFPNTVQAGNCSTFTIEESKTSITVQEVIGGKESVLVGTYSAVDIENATFMLRVKNGTSDGVVLTILPSMVLATDYSGYALIYSCSEVSSSMNQVLAWGLSREPSLTNEQQEIILGIVQSHPDLAPTYSITGIQMIDHSIQSCKINSANGQQVSSILVVLAAVLLGIKII